MKSFFAVCTVMMMLALPAAAQRGQCDGTGPKGRGQGQGQCCGKCDRQGGQRGMRGRMRGGMGQNQNQTPPPAVQEKK